MSMGQLCQICGNAPATATCQLCGTAACADHYDRGAGACADCLDSGSGESFDTFR